MKQRKFVDILSRMRAQPEISHRFPRAPFRHKKTLIASSISLAVVVSLVLGGFVAHADSIRLYPGMCLGDWENPNRASGEPQIDPASDAQAFNSENSALLIPAKGKNIYCGSFSGGDNQTKLVRVRLNLSWAFKPLVTPVIPTPPVNQEVTPQAPVVPEPAVSSTTPEVHESASSTPEVKEVLPAEPTPVPVPEVIPQPAPATEEVPPQAFLNNFLNIAHAQESGDDTTVISNGPKVTASLVFNGISNFLDVQYTLDGSTWHSIDNANLELPFTTWDEIHNVQIRIVELQSGGDLPSVYLDGMWLEAKYVPDDTVQVDEPGITSQVADAVTNASDAAISYVADVVSQVVPSAVPEESKPQPKVVTRVGIDTTPSTGSLLASIQDTLIPKNGIKTESYSVFASADQSSITFEGSCNSRYFTVLLFKNLDDVIHDPARAIVNRAFVCESNHYRYQFTVSDVPDSVDTGTYYAFIGDQGSTGPWVASTNPIPVRITKTIE